MKKNILAILVCCLLSLPAYGRAFWAQFNSSHQLSLSGAAMTMHEHADVVASNSAGMSRLEPGQHFSSGASAIDGGYSFTGTDEHGDPAQDTTDTITLLVPHFQYAYVPKTGPLSYGVALKLTYNNRISWGRDSVMKELGTEGLISTKGVNPAVAYAINKNHSISGGFTVYALEFRQRQALAEGIGSSLTTQATGTGYNFDVGYLGNVGRLFIAAHYNNPLPFRADSGTAEFSGVNPALKESIFDTDIEIEFDLPWYFEFSLGVKDNVKNPRVQAEIGVVVIGWSMFKDVTVKLDDELEGFKAHPFANEDANQLKIPQNFFDSYNYRAGVSFRVDDKLQIIAGTERAQVAIRSKYVSPLIPTGSFTAWSLGAEAAYSATTDIGVNFTTADFDRLTTSSDNVNRVGAGFDKNLNGAYTGNVSHISASLYQKF